MPQNEQHFCDVSPGITRDGLKNKKAKKLFLGTNEYFFTSYLIPKNEKLNLY